jgi:hypothetical protein
LPPSRSAAESVQHCWLWPTQPVTQPRFMSPRAICRQAHRSGQVLLRSNGSAWSLGARFCSGAANEPALSGLRATHDLTAGQLIQRSDVMDSSSSADRRLVFVPVKDVPASAAGSKVDLLAIEGTVDHPTVVPFALGVEVRSTVAGGLVVVVPSRQAAAFVYAANSMHLAAVIAEPGAAGGAEEAISGPNQAMAAAAEP